MKKEIGKTEEDVVDLRWMRIRVWRRKVQDRIEWAKEMRQTLALHGL